MSDEDRIARVARALCVADGHDPGGRDDGQNGVVEEGEEKLRSPCPWRCDRVNHQIRDHL